MSALGTWGTEIEHFTDEELLERLLHLVFYMRRGQKMYPIKIPKARPEAAPFEEAVDLVINHLMLRGINLQDGNWKGEE